MASENHQKSFSRFKKSKKDDLAKELDVGAARIECSGMTVSQAGARCRY